MSRRLDQPNPQHAIIQEFCTGSPTRHSMSGCGGHNISFFSRSWPESNLQYFSMAARSTLPIARRPHIRCAQQLRRAPGSTDLQGAASHDSCHARFHRREIAMSAWLGEFSATSRACAVDRSSVLTHRHPVHLPPARAPCQRLLFPRALQDCRPDLLTPPSFVPCGSHTRVGGRHRGGLVCLARMFIARRSGSGMSTFEAAVSISDRVRSPGLGRMAVYTPYSCLGRAP